MKKKLLVLMLIATTVVTTVGCGKKNNSEDIPLGEISDTPTTEQQEILDTDSSNIVASGETNEQSGSLDDTTTNDNSQGVNEQSSSLNSATTNDDSQDNSSSDSTYNSQEDIGKINTKGDANYVNSELKALMGLSSYLDSTTDGKIQAIKDKLDSFKKSGYIDYYRFQDDDNTYMIYFNDGSSRAVIIGD